MVILFAWSRKMPILLNNVHYHIPATAILVIGQNERMIAGWIGLFFMWVLRTPSHNLSFSFTSSSSEMVILHWFLFVRNDLGFFYSLRNKGTNQSNSCKPTLHTHNPHNLRCYKLASLWNSPSHWKFAWDCNNPLHFLAS